MSTLPEILTSDTRKAAVVEDCLSIIDSEVADKSGLSGLAIKAGYGVIKGINPTFVKQVVVDLLPEFATALGPIFEEARTTNKPIAAHFSTNSGRVADALLAITDAKAARSKSGAVKGTYDKLRSSAKKNVESAVPRLGKMVEKHAS